MRKSKIIIGALTILTAFGGTVLMTNSNVFEDQSFERESRYIKSKREGKANAAEGYFKYMESLRKNPITGKMDLNEMISAQKQALELEKTQSTSRALFGIDDWSELGPYNHGGRTRGFLIEKDDHNVLFAAGVSGGLYKTINAGKDWNFVTSLTDIDANLNITSICQTLNGDIYIGTGEGSVVGNPYYGSGNGTTQFPGNGIYKSTDLGITWTHLDETEASSYSNAWASVIALAADPIDPTVIYACTDGSNNGFYKITDGVAERMDDAEGSTMSSAMVDVVAEHDGTNYAVIASSEHSVYVSKNGSDFTKIGEENGMPKTTSARRIDVTIAPSDVNYMYASVVAGSGCLEGIYQSKDMGGSWTQIGNGGSEQFEPFATHCQGWYDNVIGVSAHYPDVVYVGGVELWMWQTEQGWNRISNTNEGSNPTFYVHSDVHMIASHPTDTGKMYIGTDGGVFMTETFAYSFTHLTHGYKTMQCYDAKLNVDGSVVTGFQDNGTHIIDFFDDETETLTNSKNVHGGDGGTVAASWHKEEVYIGQSQYGNVERSANNGGSFSGFYDINIDPNSNLGGLQEGEGGKFDFVTPFYLWEDLTGTTYDTIIEANLPKDSIIKAFAGRDIDLLTLLDSVLADGSLPNDTLNTLIKIDTIVDTVTTPNQFFIGKLNGELWMTREVLDFSVTPEWYYIADGGSGIQSIKASKNGDVVFVGTNKGLFRVKNLKSTNWGYRHSPNIAKKTEGSSTFVIVEKSFARASTDLEMLELKNPSGSTTWNGIVKGIAIDENDPDHIVVTISGYGNYDRVFESKNALDSIPTFTTISSSSFPDMPAYSVVIDAEDGNNIYVGTDYGVYATSSTNGSSTAWSFIGPTRTPVFALDQRDLSRNALTDGGAKPTGYSMIAGTHGRGVWGLNYDPCELLGLTDEECEAATGINENGSEFVFANQLLVYPNPMTDFANVAVNLVKSADVNVKVMNIAGSLMTAKSFSDLSTGLNTLEVDMSSLENGVYFIRTEIENEVYTNKVILMK